MTYMPPFSITPRILSLSQSISHALGVLEGEKLDAEPIKLRRENNIKTIQSSLAIEGNTLSLQQVTHIFEGIRVLGPKKDIIEVQNALLVYGKFDQLNPLSIGDFLYAHKILMQDLIEDPGAWRGGGVGIFNTNSHSSNEGVRLRTRSAHVFEYAPRSSPCLPTHCLNAKWYKGAAIAHVAPPAKRVPELMRALFEFLKKNKETPFLLKACIFHYELEFIHPFMDGNGCMGRLWQQLLLSKENPIFKFITVEELIKEDQKNYYKVLEDCDKAGDSTQFIEFSLNLILVALEAYRKSTSVSHVRDPESRLHYARKELQGKWFSRKEYMDVFKNISTSTASRDLKIGLDYALLEKKGEQNQALYRYSF